MGASEIIKKIFPPLTRSKRGLAKAEFIPRAPRVLGGLLDQLVLHLIWGQEVIIPKIVDISVSGIAVKGEDLAKLGLLPKGQAMGRVLLSGEEIGLSLSLARVEQNIYCFRFEGNFSRLRSLLYQHFTPEFLGAAMMAVAEGRLAQRGSGLAARWFTSESGDELYFALDAMGVARIVDINVFGIRVRMNREAGLLIAFSEGFSEEDSNWSRTLPADAIAYLRRFLASIRGLSAGEASALDEIFAS